VALIGDDVNRLVHHYCVAAQTARYGPYRVASAADDIPHGDMLIQGRLYRYRLIDQYGRPVDLQVYVGLGGLGGALWEQEVRLLLRLGGSGLASLPEILEGGTRTRSRRPRRVFPPKESRSSRPAGRITRWPTRARPMRYAPIQSSH
jgi:hypothetical protein